MSSSLSSSSSKLRAIVTGANKGIGFEIARALVAQGFHVVLACRDRVLGESAAAQLRALSADPSSSPSSSSCVDVLELDVSKPDSISKFIENVSAAYPSIDVLVNNAAIAYKNNDPTPFKVYIYIYIHN